MIQPIFGDYKTLLKILSLIISVLQIRLPKNILTKFRILLIINTIKNEVFLENCFLSKLG